MSNAKSSWFKLSMISFAVVALAAVNVPMHGQDVPAVHVDYSAITGVPQDWTHHHLVFSNPGSEENAIKAGRYNEWLQIVHDPRYVMQQMRRGGAVQGPAADDVAVRQSFSSKFAPVSGGLGSRSPGSRFTKPTFQTSPLEKDWSTALTASAVMPNTFPAKYSFSTTGTPSCTNDFVVFPTGATGSGTSPTIVAYNNIYPGALSPGCGSATPETVYWAYNTGAGAVTTSPILYGDGTKLAFIQVTGTAASLVLLKWAPNNGTFAAAVTPTTATTMNCTAPCMVTLALSGGANDTFSSPYYVYGSDTLFVGDNAGKLHKFTGVFFGTPTEATPITLNATTGVTIASPIYDSTSGCVFVGDSLGFLYSVNSGIAGGATCTSGTFSAHVASTQLGGAAGEGIFDGVLVDSTAGMVYAFVADTAAVNHDIDGTINTANTTLTVTTGTLTSADVGRTITGTGVRTGTTIATVTSGTTGTLSQAPFFSETAEALTIEIFTAGNEAVAQFPTSFGATAIPSDGTTLGTGTANDWVFSGTFDNTYYSSGTPATPSGNIYVVGNNTPATLYRVPITSNAVGTAVTTTVGSTLHGWPSPVTEFYNPNATPAADSIYFSVNRGNVGTCTNGTGDGCIIAYNVTSGTPVLEGETNFTYPGTNGCWGTSAFIIDNGSSNIDATNVYFEYFGGDSPSTPSTNCTAVTSHSTTAVSESQGGTF